MRARRTTPTGIDRFELEYARWLTERYGPRALYIRTDRWSPSVLDTRDAVDVVKRLSVQWSARGQVEPAIRRLAAAIDRGEPWRRPAASRMSAGRDLASTALDAAVQTLTATRRRPPADTVLVHVSHAGLENPKAYAWLASDGPRGIFYLHDIIPISHAEYVRPGADERHRNRLTTILRHGRLVICNSEFTREAFVSYAQGQGRRVPQTVVIPPGVEPCFRSEPSGPFLDIEHPFFLTVGTVEGRKNHLLLLNLWRRLAEKHGSKAPKLLVVGRRGWVNHQVLAMLDRCQPLAQCVIEVSDLDDEALAWVMRHARALLAPSFVEGYDMPSVEALASGTPVIASDIPVHREILRGDALLIDPLDGLGWMRAVEDYASMPKRAIARPQWIRDWASHFRALEAALAGF